MRQWRCALRRVVVAAAFSLFSSRLRITASPHFSCSQASCNVPKVSNIIEEGKKSPLEFHKITLHKICDHIETKLYTASGWPSVSGDSLKALARKISTAIAKRESLEFGVDTPHVTFYGMMSQAYYLIIGLLWFLHFMQCWRDVTVGQTMQRVHL